MSENPPIEPHLSLQEREELAHIAYFLEQLEGLRARGLIAPDAYRTIDTDYAARRDGIERRGRIEAALSAARALSRSQPLDALVWAERARKLDPARQEAWTLSIDLHARLHQYDDACALCVEAAPWFLALPDKRALQDKLAELRREKERYEGARQRELERQMRERTAADRLAKAQEAWGEARYDDVVAWCSQVLEIQADNSPALSLLAAAHDRLGNFDRSIALYRELRRLQPGELIWPRRVREVRRRRGEAPPVDAESVPARPVAPPPEPAISWSSIAGEFLQEHWQKLILCLAVLLIVVSSTVGAHHLLGPQLWSPEGKCILALVYTLLFAAFGCGLMKWGAEGAGRMVLLTALIVVPVNFALAGELQLLIHPTAPHLLVLALSAAALLFLSGVILAALDSQHVGLFPLAFFALSAFNATMGPDVSFRWGFAAFILLAWLFLGAVWKLNTRLGDEPAERGPNSAYFAPGLLSYAFLFGALRAGILVLHLIPTLYALPVMLTAIACAHTAHSLQRFDQEFQRASLLRFGGQVLAAVAFALALSRPPEPSPLLSGNTLATALLGLALFAASLRAYRQPAYLYCAFAALFVAYFGAGYFIGDVVAAIEDTARRALGYEHRLPTPFKSLNGLVFNIILALLALQFARRWNDERLARHCHYIALPLSLAACTYSCFEPKAAVLCLSGYSVLYAIAVWLFAQPLLTYLACAAFAGAAFFAATLLPGLTTAAQALGAAGIGVVFWAACSALADRRVSDTYRAPLVHASLAMSALALWAATVSVLPPQPVSYPATLTFFVVALLSLLLGIAYPRAALASLAVITANIGYTLAVVYANRKLQLDLTTAQFGIAASGASVALCILGQWLKRVGERRSAEHGHASRASLYVFPLFHLALAQAALGVALSAVQALQPPARPAASDFASIAIALALSTGALVMASTFAYRTTGLAYLAVWTGTAAFGAAVLSGLTALNVDPLPAPLAVAFGALALLLHLAGERTAQEAGEEEIGVGDEERPPFPHPPILIPHPSYREPLLHTAFLAMGLTWLLCASSWSDYPLVAVALALTTLTLAASTRLYPAAPLAHMATASALGVWLCVFQIVRAGATAAPAVYGVVVATFALALLAVGEWTGRQRGEEKLSAVSPPTSAHPLSVRTGSPLPTAGSRQPAALTRPSSLIPRPLADALPDFALVALFAAVGLAAWRLTNGLPVILTLTLAALGLWWLTRFKREGTLVYLSLTGAAAAILCFSGRCLDWTEPGAGVAWLALTTAVLSLALWATGFLCRRCGRDRFYVDPCFQMSLVLTGGVFALVAAACMASTTAFPVSVIALMLNAIAYLLLSTVWRVEALTYAAVAALVAGAHLALPAVGSTSLASVGAHALLMAAMAIALWLAGFGCQSRTTQERGGIYFRPLFVSSLLLALLAVPLAFTSPLALLLLAFAFLLMVRSFPSAGWLYAVIGAAAGAVSTAYLAGLSDDRWVEASVCAAFALWALGVVVQRVKPALCARLQLSELGYEFPLFNSALAASAVAIALRVGASVLRGDAWTAHAALLPALAVFYLLMLKAYPHRGWVHLSVALFTSRLAIEALPFLRILPEISGAAGWLLAGIVGAHFWGAVSLGLQRVEEPLCRWLDVRGEGCAEVVRNWSLALFTTVASLGSAMVITTTLTTVFALPTLWAVSPAGVWWGILVTLVLAGAYMMLHLSSLGVDRLLIGLHAVLLLIVGWLGAPSSPVTALLGVPATAYYPLATAGAGLATILIGRRFAAGTGARKVWLLGDAGDCEVASLADCAWQEGIALTAAALAFTRGVIDFVMVMTLLLAAANFAVLAVSRRRVEFVYTGSGLFVAACLCTLLALAAIQGISALPVLATYAAFAALLSAVMLLAAAAWLQQRRSAPEMPITAAAPKPPSRAPAA